MNIYGVLKNVYKLSNSNKFHAIELKFGAYMHWKKKIN